MKTSLTRRTFLSELRVLWAFNVREFITYIRYTFNPIFDIITEPLYVLN